MNRCLGWVQLTQKKWKNHFCYHVNIFNHSLLSLFWEKTSSLYVCSLKNVQFFCRLILVFPKLCFQWEQWLCVQYHQFKKTTEAKKVSNFHVATFVWIIKTFEFVSSKLGLSARNSWGLTVKKCFTPPIKRLLHLLFYFKKVSTKFHFKKKKFPFCFCKILMWKGSNWKSFKSLVWC